VGCNKGEHAAESVGCGAAVASYSCFDAAWPAYRGRSCPHAPGRRLCKAAPHPAARQSRQLSMALFADEVGARPAQGDRSGMRDRNGRSGGGFARRMHK